VSPAMRTVGKFVWHQNNSADVEKAKRFYGELLGWKTETWKLGEIDYAKIKVDGQTQGAFGTAKLGTPPRWLGHVLVEDVDATAERARAAGGKVFAGPLDIPELGRVAVIADPQGAVLSAFAGELQAGEGTFVWDELVTSDVEAAKRFYGEVFEWSTHDSDLGERGTYSVFRHAGTGTVGGCMQLESVQVPPHWRVHIATEDVDAAVARAKKLGATALLEGTDVPNVGRIAVLLDPVSAVFCLYS
jgi:predicted enzyme related to lactoylglutathione lyase